LHISLTIEEFADVFLEMEEASSAIHEILLTKVQKINASEEIN
jgi:hypothetical protein